VPTTGSASAPDAMTALPIVRSAPTNTLERTFFMNVLLRLVPSFWVLRHVRGRAAALNEYTGYATSTAAHARRKQESSRNDDKGLDQLCLLALSGLCAGCAFIPPVAAGSVDYMEKCAAYPLAALKSALCFAL